MRRPARVSLLVLAAGLAQSAPAQKLGQAPDSAISLWRVVGALLVCVVFAAAAAWLLRKRTLVTGSPWTRGERRLELVETLPLGHATHLCLLRCDGKELLLAVSAHGATFGDLPGTRPDLDALR